MKIYYTDEYNNSFYIMLPKRLSPEKYKELSFAFLCGKNSEQVAEVIIQKDNRYLWSTLYSIEYFINKYLDECYAFHPNDELKEKNNGNM